MRDFAALVDAIDATTATSGKVEALVRYFREAPPADRAWAVAFLTGRRPRRLVKLPDLRRWAAEAAGIPDWLFEEAYAHAGDLAETVALLVPGGGQARGTASRAAPTSPPGSTRRASCRTAASSPA
jgi:DNA ligase-1